MFFEIFLGYKDETILSWLSFFHEKWTSFFLKLLLFHKNCDMTHDNMTMVHDGSHLTATK